MTFTKRPVSPLLLAIAALVAAGGYVHLREWSGSYRSLPSAVPGAAVVKLGFPITAAISAVLAVVLIVMALRRQDWNRTAVVVLGVTAVFQAVSLATLILSLTDSVFGWSEPAWTRGADQIRALEIGALICLAQAAGLRAMMRRTADRLAPSGPAASDHRSLRRKDAAASPQIIATHTAAHST